jgi:hypothetical protein
MIGLTEKHYAAIGRVAVESCTLDREVGEYLTRLGALPRRHLMFGDKVALLKKTVMSRRTDATANTEFTFSLAKVGALIDRRNALAHGVWISDANSLAYDDTIARGGKATVRAGDIATVAAQLRIARKPLLRLCHEYCPIAAGSKKRPAAPIPQLIKQLR